MDTMAFAAPDGGALPIRPVLQEHLREALSDLPPEARSWAEAAGFRAGAGETLLIPGAGRRPEMVLAGMGSEADRLRQRFVFAGVRDRLPPGLYRLEDGLVGEALSEAALGWLLAGYRFERYVKPKPEPARLVAPDGVDVARLEAIAAGEALTRDLINTPASDMGPAELEDAAQALVKAFGGSCDTVEGDALIAGNLPMIHAVGRASPRSPRLIDLRWGDAGPRITLVGKGVCFDTGGLNLKPGASMSLMKKDMGGAANVLGLARTIMSTGAPMRLRVLIPAVENAVSGASFRPGDILASRKGLTVEINNTDAEGRLVLADALALADEDDADLIVSMATLTGAARVAVGPDLAPFFTGDDGLASALAAAAGAVRDPVWRLPFWDPYETMIEPGIADLDNAPSGGMAGSITAALFLRRFVQRARYLHFDIYGWTPKPAPARPKGGVGQGWRALFEALPGALE